ncbi:MAG: hypothetical protein PW792_08170 [Acidobacteriaceae bacterium]|nr:hypothetical protein [Acidobacteriaceae bacterium]
MSISHMKAPISPVRLDRKGSAAYLSLSVRSVDYLIQQERLKPVRDGGKVFVMVADLDRYAKADHNQPIRPVAGGR